MLRFVVFLCVLLISTTQLVPLTYPQSHREVTGQAEATTVLLASLPAHFTSCLDGTGNVFNATVLMPTASSPDVNGTPLPNGSEIAVFSSDAQYPNLCVGVLVWQGSHSYITVWGDNDLTSVRDGLRPNESLAFRVWDSASGTEYGAGSVWVSFSQSNPVYNHDAMLVVQDLSVLPRPADPVLASPSNGATGVSISPTLTWNAVQGAASYHLQVATDVNFNNRVVNETTLTGTTHAVAGLAHNTRYFWRLKASNAAGASGWSAVSNFTTEGAPTTPPPAPVLASPSNGATGVSINPTLTWNVAQGADSYHLQVATDVNFNNVFVDEAALAAVTHAISGLNYVASYFWRVRGNNEGGAGPWSSVSRFTTEQAPVVPPPAPVLASPSDGAAGVSINPTLTWNVAQGAVTYHLQMTLGTDPGFNTPMVNDNAVTELSYALAGLSHSTQYLWRVKASNSSGSSGWSAVWDYTTEQAPVVPPPAPVLASPSNGAGNIETEVALTWQTASGADTYRLQVALDQNFANLVVNDGSLTSTTEMVTGLVHATEYFWRVRGTNLGGAGLWSPTWRFTTEQAQAPLPEKPHLLEPAHGAMGVSANPTLVWQAANHATHYHVQVSTSRYFSQRALDEPNLTSSSFDASGLEYGTKYFWRVRASNATGSSEWSFTFRFKTENAPVVVPPAPTLASPANGAANVSVNPTLVWNAVQGADSYRLQVATDAGFGNMVFNQSGLTNTARQVPGLQNDRQYFWRVSASNAGGVGSWSSIWAFATQGSPQLPPNTPRLLEPAHGVDGISVTPTFRWIDVPNTTNFQLQVSTSRKFSTLIVNEKNLTEASFQASGLQYGRRYFWRVRARNAAGTSQWSSTWQFNTTNEGRGLAAPPLVEPSNASVGVSPSVLLVWASASGASAYRLQVAERDDFSKMVVDEGDLTSNTYEVEELDEQTTYYWRVQSGNHLGEGTWSNAQYFTTGTASALLAPRPMLPAHDAVDVQIPSTFTWQIAPFATSYRIQVMRLSASGGIEEVMVDSTGLTGSSLRVQTLQPGTQYLWQVQALSNLGGSPWSIMYRFRTSGTSTPTANEAEAEEVPEGIALHQNYPNPFNPETTIAFDVPESMNVTVKVYDMLGKEVATLLSETLPAGNHQVQWNASGMPSGVYIYQLRAGRHTYTKALSLIK